jgi:hypothetical protein
VDEKFKNGLREDSILGTGKRRELILEMKNSLFPKSFSFLLINPIS